MYKKRTFSRRSLTTHARSTKTIATASENRVGYSNVGKTRVTDACSKNAAMSGLAPRGAEISQSAFVKSFGRRQAYESLRGTNPRGPRQSAMGIERSGLMARASAMAGEGLGGDGGVIRRDRPTASTGWSERWPAGLGLDRAAGSAGRGGRGATLLRPRLEGRRHDGG